MWFVNPRMSPNKCGISLFPVLLSFQIQTGQESPSKLIKLYKSSSYIYSHCMIKIEKYYVTKYYVNKNYTPWFYRTWGGTDSTSCIYLVVFLISPYEFRSLFLGQFIFGCIYLLSFTCFYYLYSIQLYQKLLESIWTTFMKVIYM